MNGPARDDPYGDVRLVTLYDEDNPDGPDHDFFRAVADQSKARRIVDPAIRGLARGRRGRAARPGTPRSGD